MAKCPVCNHEVSIFSGKNIGLASSHPSLDAYIFTCNNCKKESRATSLSVLILYIIIFSLLFFLLRAVAIITNGGIVTILLTFLGIILLGYWLGWRYVIRLRIKDVRRDTFKSFRLSI